MSCEKTILSFSHFQHLLTLSLLSPLSSLLSPPSSLLSPHLLIKFPPFISFILSFSLSPTSLSPPFSLYQFQDLRKSNHFIRLKMKLLRTKTIEGSWWFAEASLVYGCWLEGMVRRIWKGIAVLSHIILYYRILSHIILYYLILSCIIAYYLILSCIISYYSIFSDALAIYNVVYEYARSQCSFYHRLKLPFWCCWVNPWREGCCKKLH